MTLAKTLSATLPAIPPERPETAAILLTDLKVPLAENSWNWESMMRVTELLSRRALLLAPECADAWLARMQYLLTTKQTDLTLQLAET